MKHRPGRRGVKVTCRYGYFGYREMPKLCFFAWVFVFFRLRIPAADLVLAFTAGDRRKNKIVQLVELTLLCLF